MEGGALGTSEIGLTEGIDVGRTLGADVTYETQFKRKHKFSDKQKLKP